ncbi:MAG: hypothetical protein DBY36_01050 [Clostridiales bacterium]|nr:MAG: hypothetical protein DBY36_01050 [Clostridiales bacterium]
MIHINFHSLSVLQFFCAVSFIKKRRGNIVEEMQKKVPPQQLSRKPKQTCASIMRYHPSVLSRAEKKL